MGSKWRKVKLALGLNLCVYVPKTAVNEDNDDASSLPPSLSGVHAYATSTHARELKLSNSSSKFSKKICSICLASMRRGDGQAIFSAECSHSFHFQCIASNVKHGNQICPVCRAKWKEIPLQGPKLDPPAGRARVNPVDWSQNNTTMTIIQRLPPRLNSHGHVAPLSQTTEPSIFNDDESLDCQTDLRRVNDNIADVDEHRTMSIKTYTEVLELQRSDSRDDFNVLVHVKAPPASNLNRDSTRIQANVSVILKHHMLLLT